MHIKIEYLQLFEKKIVLVSYEHKHVVQTLFNCFGRTEMCTYIYVYIAKDLGKNLTPSSECISIYVRV